MEKNQLKDEEQHIYISIDLKSFYASVECRERQKDPLTTNLVVADASRTKKTICLAVSPSLKRYGIPGRARLFEVVQKVKFANAERLNRAPGHRFTGASDNSTEINSNPALAIDYITATPRMALYMEYSTKIYNIYLKYVAPEDIHVYSIDEVFIDVTHYLKTYNLTARELAMKMIREVLEVTGITATAGIGTNLYLCKIAMDIVAKHVAADEDGVRIAQLDEMTYRQKLWDHKPLIDFWRVGRGYSKKLEKYGLVTMGDIARCSLGGPKDFYNEDLLYKLFGVNAELLIDHAWGWEPCTIRDIKAYRPENNSLGSGQVLQCAYTGDKGRIVVREMIEQLSLDLVGKKLVTDQIVITVGYDIENLSNKAIRDKYNGPITTDHYGRKIPKAAHGTAKVSKKTSSTTLLVDAVMELYDRIVDPNLLVRRINIAANHVVSEEIAEKEEQCGQLDMFSQMAVNSAGDNEVNGKTNFQVEVQTPESLEEEKKMQQAMLEIKKKFGKNAILKGTNLEEGATTINRNKQIGGHKA